MADAPAPSLRERNRQSARNAVLDAAERLLERGDTAEFSMRALAAEAGVGFATPFNHFGSKTEITRALSARLIERMGRAFAAKRPKGDFADRVFAMADVAVALLLEKPGVHRVVVGSLGVPGPTPTAVLAQSQALWAAALGDLRGDPAGLAADVTPAARDRLAAQLAFAFRGCLSFWIAGEVPDDALRTTVRSAIAALLLGFVGPDRRARVLSQGTGPRR